MWSTGHIFSVTCSAFKEEPPPPQLSMRSIMRQWQWRHLTERRAAARPQVNNQRGTKEWIIYFFRMADLKNGQLIVLVIERHIFKLFIVAEASWSISVAVKIMGAKDAYSCIQKRTEPRIGGLPQSSRLKQRMFEALPL